MDKLLESKKDLEEQIKNLQGLRKDICSSYEGIKGIKKCAYFPKCRYGSKCKYSHVLKTHAQHQRELECIDKKLHELYKKLGVISDVIYNIESKNKRICPDLCLEIKYSFKVNSCQDCGSGCGCEEVDDFGYIVHEDPYNFENMVSYTWLDPKYFEGLSDGRSCNYDLEKFEECACSLKYDLERYKRFGSSFNFVGRGSKGELKIHSIRTLPAKYDEKCVGMVDSEDLTCPKIIKEAVIDLPDGYEHAGI